MILLNQGLETLTEAERIKQSLSVAYNDTIEALMSKPF